MYQIKTVGSTYMAAAGLNPEQHESGDADGEYPRPPHEALCALVDFAGAMQQRLDDLNTHSFNNFRLRVGIACGPVVGGVIGARKPVFDVWGNTVNEASRMDSTGVEGKIQVPRDTAAVSLYFKIATINIHNFTILLKKIALSCVKLLNQIHSIPNAIYGVNFKHFSYKANNIK